MDYELYIIELYPDIICPITQEIMNNPVITNNGISYEKSAINKWLDKEKICPITLKYLDKKLLTPNINLKNTISHIKHNFNIKEISYKNLHSKSETCCIIL